MCIRDRQSTTRVALDAMGGDNAPAEVVKGAVDAVNKRNDIKIFLVGQKVPVCLLYTSRALAPLLSES